MAWKENTYGREQLVGNVDLPFVSRPTLRGRIRRHDPDIDHAATYFDGLTGTSLELELSGVVGTTTILFATDDYQDALDAINGALPTDITASDEDGYLRLTHNQGGETHFLKVVSGDACPILGFDVFPIPGSISFAGELVTASSGFRQSNPQGTAMHAHGETYNSAVLNRSIYGSLLKAERYLKDYEKDLLTTVEVPVTVSVHPLALRSVFYITDANLKLCQGFHHFGISVSNPSGVSDGIDRIVSILDTNRADIYTTGARGQGPAGVGTPGTHVRIDGVFYGSAATALNDALAFATWGTPDGKSIFGSAVSAKFKVGSVGAGVTITAIRGNLLEAPGANFITARVRAGDTVEISAAVATSPFDHEGEYVVEEVYTEDTLSVKAKGDSEPGIGSLAGSRPTKLNPAGLGVVKIFVGAFVPAHSLAFRLNRDIPNGTYTARLLVGKRQRGMLATEQVTRDVAGSRDRISLELWDHINRTAPGADAHPATVISVQALSPWANTDPNPATDLQNRLSLMLTALANTNPDESGTSHLGAEAISGGPFSLSSGTLFEQLAEYLGIFNNHVLGNNQHHQAQHIEYAGSPVTRGGWFIPAGNIEAVLDALVGVPGIGASGLSNTTSGVGWLNNVNTWIHQNTFNGETGDDRPALRTTAIPTIRKLLWSFRIGSKDSVAVFGRLYATTTVSSASANGFEATINAGWDTTTSRWVRDTTADAQKWVFAGLDAAASTYTFGIQSFTRYRVDNLPGNSNWTDVAGSSLGWHESNRIAKSPTPSGVFATGATADTDFLRAIAGYADFPRAANSISARTLVWTFGGVTGTHAIRVYRSSQNTEALEIAINCRWERVVGVDRWLYDDVGSRATLVQLNRDRLRALGRPRQADTIDNQVQWIDSSAGWITGFPILAIEFAAQNSLPAVGYTNTLTAKHIVKAWGVCEIAFGAATTGEAPGLVVGLNASSAALVTNGSGASRKDYVLVTLADGIVGANFAAQAVVMDLVTPGMDGASVLAMAVVPETWFHTPGSFRISFKSTNTSGYAVLTSGVATLYRGSVSFQVCGAQ